MIEFRVWDVTGQAVIQANAVYNDENGTPWRRNIGALLLEWNLQAIQPLDSIIYELGKEIRLGWRELSSPKE